MYYYSNDPIGAITIHNNYTQADIYDLSLGKIVNSVQLSKDESRLPFTDAFIVNATKENMTYMLMSNTQLKINENHKEKRSLSAGVNETYVFVGYDSVRQSAVIGTIKDDEKEVKTWPINGGLEPFKFGFDQYNDILLKSAKNVLILKLQSENGVMIMAHSIEKREIMFNDIAKEVGEQFQLQDIILPTDMILLKSKKEIAVMVIHELALAKVQIVDSQEGEYGFGANEITSKAYMVHSDQNGYKIFVAEPRKPFRMIYETETELNRRLYGDPELVFHAK